MKKLVILITLLVAMFAFSHVTSAPAVSPTQLEFRTDRSHLPSLAGLPFDFLAEMPSQFPSLHGFFPELAEVKCMQENIYFEARGAGEAGMKAVAQVTLNRSRSGSFPRTICGVVHERNARGVCQFSWFCDHHAHRHAEAQAWHQCGEVARLALTGQMKSQAQDALYYHATYVHPGWANHMKRVGKIGNQIFYRG